jgi:hypothetical protein
LPSAAILGYLQAAVLALMRGRQMGITGTFDREHTHQDTNAFRLWRGVFPMDGVFSAIFKSISKCTPHFLNYCRMSDESREVTIYDIRFSPAAETQTMIDRYFRFRLILWYIVCPLIDVGTITPFDDQSSYSEIPIS